VVLSRCPVAMSAVEGCPHPSPSRERQRFSSLRFLIIKITKVTDTVFTVFVLDTGTAVTVNTVGMADLSLKGLEEGLMRGCG